MDEVGINAARRPQDLDRREAIEDLFPQDAQSQFGEPIADAAMDAEAELNICGFMPPLRASSGVGP
jgi:hypothetical protein